MRDTAPLAPVDPQRDVEADFRETQLTELRRIRFGVTMLVLLAAAMACYFARDMVLPLILGVMLALTLSPVVRVLQRRGIPSPISAVVLILSLGIGTGVASYAMSGPVSEWLTSLPQMRQQIEGKLDTIFESVEKVQEASKQVEEITDSSGEAMRVQIEQPGFLNSALSNAATVGATIAVALVMALFVLAAGDMFTVKIIESFPKMSDKKRALKIVYGVERAISRYLLTITLINAALGGVIFLMMWAIGLPYAYIWGVVAFAFNFLPFIGAVAGIFLVGAFALLSFDTLSYALLAPALYMAATSLEGQIITPAIVGRRLELNTVSVFVTVVFWGWLWGIAGALMAVPFLVIVKVICDHIPAMQTLGNFLGSSTIKVEVEPEPKSDEAVA
ncbi:putative PurR-regulated permease PerM [Palleronia aestuarii]|uniref:Putative PurR-regulated permease PerM n=1 Tax=Palleronia aestuarii TaxID=568105 RepID=A0A2W7NHY8_9RHOB|nr:AI-2E family transporter [Palleronia aestuarii]PZX19063.1 putative PurR-regulated permease PerM [Palleronia aestuarii]